MKQYLWGVAALVAVALAFTFLHRPHPGMFILTPPTYSGAGAPLVIYHHGAGETAQSLRTDPLKQGVVNALLRAGYLVAACDAHGDNWGRPEANDDYAALLAFVRSKWRVTRVVFLSQSMGGLSGLNCLADPRFADVHDWYGIYPVCSLGTMWAHGQGRFAPDIRLAFDIQGNALPVRVTDSDPCLHDGTFAGRRLKCVASYSDRVVYRIANADRLKLIAPWCVIDGADGEHGDPSHFRPDDVVSFFEQGKWPSSTKAATSSPPPMGRR